MCAQFLNVGSIKRHHHLINSNEKKKNFESISGFKHFKVIDFLWASNCFFFRFSCESIEIELRETESNECKEWNGMEVHVKKKIPFDGIQGNAYLRVVYWFMWMWRLIKEHKNATTARKRRASLAIPKNATLTFLRLTFGISNENERIVAHQNGKKEKKNLA